MKNKKILAIIMLVITIATLVVPMFSLNTFAADNEISLNGSTWSLSAGWLARGYCYGYDIDFDINEYQDMERILVGFEWVYDFEQGKTILQHCDDSIACSRLNDEVTVTIKNDEAINITFKSDVKNNVSSQFIISWFMLNLQGEYVLKNAIANSLLPWSTFINDYINSYRPFWYDNDIDSYKLDLNKEYGIGYNKGNSAGYKFGYECGYDKGLLDSSGDYSKGYEAGMNSNFGKNVILNLLSVPKDFLNNLVLFEVGELSISLWNIFTTILGVSLFIWFLKIFAR